MVACIIIAGLGLLISILGVINMTGNISSLHWYHRQRVTEENRKPFGRLVGLGTLVIGIAIIVFSALLFLCEKTKLDWIALLGTAILLTGIVSGMIISFYAMIKYNKGIF